MISTKHWAKWVSWISAGGLRLPGRVDLDHLVEIDRQGMPGHLRLVGQQGRCDARLAQQGRQRRPRLGRRRTHRVPPLPVRAVQSLQLRRVHQGLVEDHRLAGQPVQRRRLDPRVSVGAEVARVQPVDDKADGIHAAIVADGGTVRKGIMLK